MTDAALDLATVGEVMIRLSPPGQARLEQAESLDVTVGGAEGNVAVGVARLGLRAAWISKLPADPFGRRVAGELRRHGVDTSRERLLDRARSSTTGPVPRSPRSTRPRWTGPSSPPRGSST